MVSTRANAITLALVLPTFTVLVTVADPSSPDAPTRIALKLHLPARGPAGRLVGLPGRPDVRDRGGSRRVAVTLAAAHGLVRVVVAVVDRVALPPKRDAVAVVAVEHPLGALFAVGKDGDRGLGAAASAARVLGPRRQVVLVKREDVDAVLGRRAVDPLRAEFLRLVGTVYAVAFVVADPARVDALHFFFALLEGKENTTSIIKFRANLIELISFTRFTNCLCRKGTYRFFSLQIYNTSSKKEGKKRKLQKLYKIKIKEIEDI